MFGLGLGQVSMGSGGGGGIAYARPQATGQTTSYRTGDDAWGVVNQPYPAPPPNPSYWAELSDHTTLVNNNAFGNTNRFTDENGLQVYGSGYFIDHYTGLGYAISRGFGNFNAQIDAALLVSVLGYTDFRLINASEMESLRDEHNNGLNYSPLNTFWAYDANYYHTSTTSQISSTKNFKANREQRAYALAKTTGAFGIRVRNHY